MARYVLAVLFMMLSGCAGLVTESPDFNRLYGIDYPKPRVMSEQLATTRQQQHKVSFAKDIKPILDSRCVACHGCYDAPCQLKLGSIEGLDRGATKQEVYASLRLSAADPTRLFIDAPDIKTWRQKGFYPVLNERDQTIAANVDNSVLANLVKLKRLNPLTKTGKLGDQFDLDIDRSLECPRMDELSEFQKNHPHWGMPYAMPGLSLQEEDLLLQWLRDGAKVEPPPPLAKQATAAIAKWENYFNGDSLKQKLVFRYIYEHLFIGHLHFKGHPDHEFYRLVRSSTPPGQPIAEINTVRPYDDPGTSHFYYRLRPVTETLVDKTHFVYELSDQKMQRFNELFFKPDYQVTTLPSYQPSVAANPFKAFIELPLAAKNRFLLDDAEYFVSGFIKGPVCRGQIATESIRDRFWIVFFQPKSFYPEKVAQELAENNQVLGLPGEESDEIGLFGWTKYDEFGREFLQKKDQFFNEYIPKRNPLSLQNIWDGEGHNENAALTVFRHYDSATVVKGLVGDTPLTAWVMDYTIFERLHYLLVAGFNVFGTTSHQLASRTYMDILRIDAETSFLRFLPAFQRRAIFNSWYLGMNSFRTPEPLFSVGFETQVKFKTTNYQQEFFDQVRQRLGAAAGRPDTINHCRQTVCERVQATPIEQETDDKIRRLAQLKGLELGPLPEMSLLRVKTSDPNSDLVYTLLIDRAYSNISKITAEDSHRIPENDRLTVVPGFVGSYPNFSFVVDSNQLDEFINTVRHARSEAELEHFYRTFGIRRTSPDIWQHLDWFNRQHQKYRGLQAGLLDLNRYEDL